MRILIITPLFPPQNAVGALRPYTWAKYWGREGHKVDVFTVESYGIESGLKIDLPNVTVRELSIPFFSKMAKKWQKVNNSSSNSTQIKSKKTIFTLLKTCYRSFIDKSGCIMSVRFPDMRDLWAKKIISVIAPDDYDMVITTGCPYSVHRVGYYVKKRNPNCKWILDWRDLWTKNPYWKGLFIFRWYERILEKKFHNTSDVITVVSQGLKESLQEITKKRIEVIPNGFDPDEYEELCKEKKHYPKKLQFVYFGTIYKGVRDVTPFLDAVKKLIDEKKLLPEQIEFLVAGNVADLLTDIESYNLNEIFTYLGIIPRTEVLKYLYNCDCAIMLLGKNNKGILTGKLFEYLALSDSICGVDFSNDSDAGKIINEANCGECFDSDVFEIQKFILKKLYQKENNIVLKKDFTKLECYNRKHLAEKMLELI